MYSLKSVQAKDDEKIYSLDVNKKGAKQFIAKSLPGMWKQMEKPPLNYCEVIEDRPCHMYFDIDEGNVRETWRELETMLTRIFKTLQDQVGIVKFYYLDASKKYEDGRIKNSAHIICVGEKYIYALLDNKVAVHECLIVYDYVAVRPPSVEIWRKHMYVYMNENISSLLVG